MGLIEGRRIIITGGASGMGAGLNRAFPRMNSRVVSMDLSETTGRSTAEKSGAAGFAQVDVTDEASFTHAVTQAIETLGGLDVLVHAAGVAPSARTETMSLDLWNRVFAINATGTMLMNRAVFPFPHRPHRSWKVGISDCANRYSKHGRVLASPPVYGRSEIRAEKGLECITFVC